MIRQISLCFGFLYLTYQLSLQISFFFAFCFPFHDILISSKLEACSQCMTYDIATAPDEVPTTGWVVSQICSKHIKLSLNFFFLLSIGRASNCPSRRVRARQHVQRWPLCSRNNNILSDALFYGIRTFDGQYHNSVICLINGSRLSQRIFNKKHVSSCF